MGDIRYSVKQLARLAGVSVRTLHVYDKLGLLTPSLRTDAGYRYYGEPELLRLQQILFYKELDLPLRAISEIMDGAAALRQEAIDNWGESVIVRSEGALLAMTPDRLEQVKTDQRDIDRRLRMLVDSDPASDMVQEQIARHYELIRGFWGMPAGEVIKAAAYKGLGELYASDERYMTLDGRSDPRFAAFMRAAMAQFADTRLE